MNSPRFLVGIDLGTAHCSMASVDGARSGEPWVEDVAIPQVLRLGEVGSRFTMPSCVYLPEAHEFGPGMVALPWESEPGNVVGEFARWHGARVPGRLVVSAKSWLCHAGVDRGGPILPWGAPAGVPKISPVEATARLLRHLARAWDAAHPDAPLSAQELVITVPASFDAVARSLTVEAARLAGLEGFTLVEEPLAAFEAFAWEQREKVAEVLGGVRRVLVVDVGGGTTDFTWVEVAHSEAGPEFRRVAVGEHLVLGGDNMDVALARRIEERVRAGGKRLDAGAWSQLVQGCREAKEALLGDGSRDEYRVAVAGSGSALLGSAIAARLTRADVEETIVEGFFGACAAGDRPRKAVRTALQEVSLPFAQDPSIPRQLAGFLAAHRGACGASANGMEAGRRDSGSGEQERGLPRPDALLLNGGVFRSRRLAERLLEVVSGWWPDTPAIRSLPVGSMDLAVSRGAVCHALARHGKARKVAGGAAHAIYVGLERSGDSGRRALCVVPRGTEEGTTTELGGKVFRLTLGRPVQFPLFTSTADRVDRPGEVMEVDEGWTPMPPLHAVLRSREGKSGVATVHLRATLTEVGTLELWCVEEGSLERWRLEFELRGGGAAEALGEVASLPARFEEARRAVEEVFPPKGQPVTGDLGQASKAARQLWVTLERVLGARSDWGLPCLRELWGVVWAGMPRRRRTAEHERVFFQLAGYAARPGFGYPLDAWRCEQMAGWVAEGVQFSKERSVWTEYWVAWRRIAGGLTAERQAALWTSMRPHLAWALAPDYPKHLGRPKGVQPEGIHEMVRLVGALEHLEPAIKEEVGGWLTAQLRGASKAGGPWAWTLGRLGARLPLYGSAHRAVPPGVAEDWIRVLGDPAFRNLDGASFALAQLARRTGDPSLDIGDEARAWALEAIESAGGATSWSRMVREVSIMERADEVRAMGDTLPVGLAL